MMRNYRRPTETKRATGIYKHLVDATHAGDCVEQNWKKRGEGYHEHLHGVVDPEKQYGHGQVSRAGDGPEKLEQGLEEKIGATPRSHYDPGRDGEHGRYRVPFSETNEALPEYVQVSPIDAQLCKGEQNIRNGRPCGRRHPTKTHAHFP